MSSAACGSSDKVEKKGKKKASSTGSREQSDKEPRGRGSVDSLTTLGNIMLNGFKNLESSLSKMGETIAENITKNIAEKIVVDDEELEYELEPSDGSEMTDMGALSSEDLLKKLEHSFSEGDPVPEDVSPSLAKLINLMMSKKGKQEAEKERSKDYLRPGNLPFLSAPKVNRQIWMSLGTSKKSMDKKLQDVQKQFLQSAVPIVSVIEEMNRARSEGTEVDLTRMIATLSDSVAFLGSANFNMVQTRRDLIKDELGPNLKGVCSMEIPFSGEHLFGDDLNAQVKELTDARKLSEEFRSPLPFYRKGRAFQSTSYAITKRGSGSFRGQYRRSGRRVFPCRGCVFGGRFQSLRLRGAKQQ